MKVGEIITGSFERAPWGWALAGSVIVAIIKGWPAIVDASLRAKMALGDRRVSRIEKLEARIEEQRVSYEAEIGILRHELNNVSSAFEALLMMIEAKPEAAAEHVARVQALRAQQKSDAAREKAAIRAARIVATGPVSQMTMKAAESVISAASRVAGEEGEQKA